MANKSKTQRAKASAARQARKQRARELEANPELQEKPEVVEQPEAPKRSLLSKISGKDKDATENAAQGNASQAKASQSKAVVKKNANEKPGLIKRGLGFLKDVKAEMKRVTWPTKQDVIRWSVVVVVALVFFGVYVVVLDGIVTQILVGISGLSALV